MEVNNGDSINTASSEGQTLFRTNCAPCHGINKKLVGPALIGVTDRIPDKKLLYSWIRNSQAVLKSGNPYFNALYKEYNKTQMTAFPNLKNEQIDKILAYVTSTNFQYSLPVPTASK
jgi:mono/diheme cytochrome c family protein